MLALVFNVVTAPSPPPTCDMSKTYDSAAEAPFVAIAFAGVLKPDQPGGFGERSVVVVFVDREERWHPSQSLINSISKATTVNQNR